jgi:hypothetical protein
MLCGRERQAGTEPMRRPTPQNRMNMPVKNPRILNPTQVQVPLVLPQDPRPLPPEIRTMSRALFDHQRVGVTFKDTGHRKPQGNPGANRPTRQGIQNRRSASEKAALPNSGEAALDDDEDAFPYRTAAKGALDSMLEDDSRKNREDITQALAHIHEPLQQFTVLFGALKEIDSRTDISAQKKSALKNAFNEMMTDLVNRDRGAIRKGLRDGAEASPVAAKIDAARNSRGLSAGLRDLRFKIGARAKGGVDEELTAMVMAKTLLKTVGAKYTEEVMESVCSRLMPALRTISAFKEAAYILTMSDAVTFSIARTGFKIARDLKRDLVDKAGILPKQHHVEAAAILFTAAEQGWGKGKASQLLNQLVDLDGAPPLTRAKVLSVMRGAINLLPPTTWPHDKQSTKFDLIEDIDRQISNAYSEIPMLTTKAERKEEEWRSMYAAGRAPTPVERA